MIWCEIHRAAEQVPCDHAKREAEREALILALEKRVEELDSELAAAYRVLLHSSGSVEQVQGALTRARESASAVAVVSAAYCGALLTMLGVTEVTLARDALLDSPIVSVEDRPGGGVRLVLSGRKLSEEIEALPPAKRWEPR